MSNDLTRLRHSTSRALTMHPSPPNLMSHPPTTLLQAADLLELDPARQHQALCGPDADGAYDCVLDSSTFHCFGDADRERYVAVLGRLLRRGGLLVMNCMSEEEGRPGGPRCVGHGRMAGRRWGGGEEEGLR